MYGSPLVPSNSFCMCIMNTRLHHGESWLLLWYDPDKFSRVCINIGSSCHILPHSEMYGLLLMLYAGTNMAGMTTCPAAPICPAGTISGERPAALVSPADLIGEVWVTGWGEVDILRYRQLQTWWSGGVKTHEESYQLKWLKKTMKIWFNLSM